jgi:hypothetical protein
VSIPDNTAHCTKNGGYWQLTLALLSRNGIKPPSRQGKEGKGKYSFTTGKAEKGKSGSTTEAQRTQRNAEEDREDTKEKGERRDGWLLINGQGNGYCYAIFL